MTEKKVQINIEYASSIEINGVLHESVLTADKTLCFASLKAGIPHYSTHLFKIDGTKILCTQGDEINKNVVFLPSAALTITSVTEIIREIKTFIHKYADIPEDFELLSAYYVLLTWVYDKLDQINYLSFLGDTGTGKSRCKFTIGILCYKPILASAGASPAALARGRI